MTPVYSLETITAAERPWAGEKACLLGQLLQGGLPVAGGRVLTAMAWQTFWRQAAHGGGLGIPDFTGLVQPPRPRQVLIKTWLEAIATTPLTVDLTPLQALGQTLLLRASVTLDLKAAAGQGALPQDLQGMLPARCSAGQASALAEELRGLWTDALRLSRLLVWQQVCPTLDSVHLATLVQPLYPAIASGTLLVAGTKAQLAVVEGLGFALSSGEAVPARITLEATGGGGQSGSWRAGYQERAYRLGPGRVPAVQSYLRHQASLVAPLNGATLQQLYALGQQAQAQLGTAVRLEWLLRGDRNPPTCLITQAIPWQYQAAPVRLPSPPERVASSPPVVAPPLPSAIDVVIRGIAAASGRATAAAVVVRDGSQLAAQNLGRHTVVVIPDLQPDNFVHLRGVAGIVTEQGGATCHAAILARELGIPAIVGAPQATQLLASGDWIWLDGDQGLLYLVHADGPSPLPSHGQSPPAFSAAVKVREATDRRQSQEGLGSLPLQTRMMVNLSQPSLLEQLPVAVGGIGLLRAEWLMLEILEGRHPQQWIDAGQGQELEERLVDQLEPILAALAPRPVRYRSLDLRSHEWRGLLGSPAPEPNPMLGLRGALSYQQDPRLLDVELGALRQMQQRGYGNVQLILPFVRSPEEVITCRQRLERLGMLQPPGFQLWIMAEVPSVLFLLPAYAQVGVQGIALGTNDLTQLLLAVDRDQATMAAAYDERHPAVMAAMAHLIRQAHQLGLDSTICGQAPVRYPELIDQFVAWGVGGLSVELGAFGETYRRVEIAEQLCRGGEA